MRVAIVSSNVPTPETCPCVVELLSQHLRGVGAQPLLDQRGVHLTEVGGALEVVAEHQVRETRRRPVQAALHRIADHEVHLCRAVVGAQAGVLRHAPAELAVDVHHHVVGSPDPLHLLEEAGDGVRAVLQLPIVRRRLVHVRVEQAVAQRHVVQPGRESPLR